MDISKRFVINWPGTAPLAFILRGVERDHKLILFALPEQSATATQPLSPDILPPAPVTRQLLCELQWLHL